MATKGNQDKAAQGHVSYKLPEKKLRKWYCEDLMTPAQIAAAGHCSRQTVMNALDAYGIKHISQRERNFAIIDRQRDKLDKLMEKHEAAETIAAKLGVSVTVLQKYAKEHDIAITSHARHKKMLTEENLRKWYIDEGMSQQNIADIVGCHYSAVSRAMQKYNIPIKDREGIVKSMRATVKKKYGGDAPFRCESIQKNRSLSHEMSVSGERDKIVAKAQKLRKEKGLSVKSAAEKLNISYFILRRWIREAEDPSKIRTGRRAAVRIPEDKLRKMVDKGATIREIAEKFECCPVTAMKALDRYGLKTKRAHKKDDDSK